MSLGDLVLFSLLFTGDTEQQEENAQLSTTSMSMCCVQGGLPEVACTSSGDGPAQDQTVLPTFGKQQQLTAPSSTGQMLLLRYR